MHEIMHGKQCHTFGVGSRFLEREKKEEYRIVLGFIFQAKAMTRNGTRNYYEGPHNVVLHFSYLTMFV